MLCSIADVVRVKNRFDKDGVRDTLLNLRTANGHIVEVQMGFDALMLVRGWEHDMYEIVRTTTDDELVQSQSSMLQWRSQPVEAPHKDLPAGLPRLDAEIVVDACFL